MVFLIDIFRELEAEKVSADIIVLEQIIKK